jgi:hypothetical protein
MMERTMHRTPTRLPFLGLSVGTGLAAALALAGCSPTGAATASAGSTTAAAAAATTGGSPAPAASASTGSAASSVTSATGGANSASCTTADLGLQVFEGPQSGSGTVGIYVVLTNTAHSACTTYGYPGVDFYLGGTSLHEQTTRTTADGAPVAITLAPGDQATSYATYPSGSVCDAVANTVQVIPPNQTTALHAAIDYVGGDTGSKQFIVCDGNIDVGPLQAGYDGPH